VLVTVGIGFGDTERRRRLGISQVQALRYEKRRPSERQVMTCKSSLLLVALAAALTACGGSQPPPVEQKAQREESVFDPWTGTIERAKAVQQTVDEQAAAQRKQIEEATR
jgi:hypothetical protein